MTVAELTCRHCSTSISELDRFCRDCGVRLENSLRLGSPLLDSRSARVDNPLLKAEFVLLCALATFVISAIAWSVSSGKKVNGAKSAILSAANLPATTGESEISRLMKQAKSFPVSIGTTDRIVVRTPISEAKQSVESDTQTQAAGSSNQSPAAVGQLANNNGVSAVAATQSPPMGASSRTETRLPGKLASTPPVVLKADPPEPTLSIDEQLERDIPAVKQGASGHPKGGARDDVAAYNRLLEKFFAHPSGTIDGIEVSSPPLEPPTYEEWIAAGKPQF